MLPLLQHALPVPFSLDENQQRNDTTTAHISLREALANSLIHCAYTVKGNITIDRYFDRIVMSNPGTMLISMEEYLEGGHSVCRNPVLQKMFIFLGVGEKGGSGADIISKGWKDNGWAVPTLQEKSCPDRVETVLLVDQSGLSTTEGGLTTKEAGFTETLQKLYRNFTETLQSQHLEVLDLICENKEITTTEMALKLRVSRQTIANRIKFLQENGFLRRIGGDKCGYWKICIPEK